MPAKRSENTRRASAQAVRAQLKDKTERIPLKALERRGFKSVQVLDMRAIEGIVQDAVLATLMRRDEHASEAEREALGREAKAEFLKLLKEHKQLRRQKNEADRKKGEFALQLDSLHAELHQSRKELTAERERPVGEVRFTAESFQDLESNIRGLFGRLMKEQQRRSLAEVGPRALKGLSEFERELAGMIDRIMVEERSRHVEKERLDHEQKIDILERRIAKLNRTLSDTETTLRKVAKAKSIDGGQASIFDSIQGLNLEDFDFERKSELLKEIFVQNLELQGKEVLSSDRDTAYNPFGADGADSAVGASASPDASASSIPAAVQPPPLDFAAPVDVDLSDDSLGAF